ncbi:YciI family protein [Arthrobacter sp. CC3]|uniref:YciI family protein n=1 Tax=Arthrobacter sp. CC3 TaxID=3029185 RepID=UPI00326521F1
MTKYLISFPGEAMVIPEGDFESVVEASHAVIEEAKAVGVYVFGGGINEGVDPVLVAGDGSVTEGTYPGHKVPNGGYTILELPSRESALEWAAKIAVACRCSQEVREFQYDPAS